MNKAGPRQHKPGAHPKGTLCFLGRLTARRGHRPVLDVSQQPDRSPLGSSKVGRVSITDDRANDTFRAWAEPRNNYVLESDGAAAVRVRLAGQYEHDISMILQQLLPIAPPPDRTTNITPELSGSRRMKRKRPSTSTSWTTARRNPRSCFTPFWTGADHQYI